MAERLLGQILIDELRISPQNLSDKGSGNFLDDLNSARISAINGDFDLTDFFIGEVIKGQEGIPSDNLVSDLTGIRLLALHIGKQRFPEMAEALDSRIKEITSSYIKPHVRPLTREFGPVF